MEDLKSIKLELDYFDENGVRSMKQVPIKVNKPKLSDKSSIRFEWSHTGYEMTFSLSIPDHVHAFLIGKSVPDNNMSDRNGTREYDSKFSKTINSDSIKGICSRYWVIMQDYKFLKDIEKAELTKVIFYKFDNESTRFTSTWNGIDFGKKNKLNFLYAIGYTSVVNGKEIRYNEKKAVISSAYDREFYANNFIKWTEERQLFFENIQLSFEKMVNGINNFKEGLKEDTIDSVIKNDIKLLS